jgi:hypothetical protein
MDAISQVITAMPMVWAWQKSFTSHNSNANGMGLAEINLS